MANRLQYELKDYQAYDLTEVLLSGQVLYFTNVISGQIGYSLIIGNSISQIGALPFAEEVVIQSDGNVDLEDLRITGNRVKILNTGSAVRTIQTGTTGSPTTENINEKDTVNCWFDGTYWRVIDGHHIGDFKWQHKNLSSTARSLPWGWVVVDGSTISDAESPYDSETLKDMTGDARFIRSATTSNTEQADAFQGHWHIGSTSNTTPASYNAGAGSTGVYSLSGSVPSAITPAYTDDLVNGTPRTDDETRPINITMVPIVKIK